MRELTLNRFYKDDNTTLGCLTCEELTFPLFSCELSWKNNERLKSCISKGRYKINPHVSNKFGQCLIIEGIHKRSEILIHSGNTFKDTYGCILPGLQVGNLDNIPAVLQSKKALEILLKTILTEWDLIIYDSVY